MSNRTPSDIIEKKYYTIGEVASMLNVAPSLIRFWEKEFDLLAPEKTEKGTRKFSQKDIEDLKMIYHLVKEKGFTLQGAREKLRLASRVKEHSVLIESLRHVRSFLVSIRDMLGNS